MKARMRLAQFECTLAVPVQSSLTLAVGAVGQLLTLLTTRTAFVQNLQLRKEGLSLLTLATRAGSTEELLG